jgi:hypothetical protein
MATYPVKIGDAIGLPFLFTKREMPAKGAIRHSILNKWHAESQKRLGVRLSQEVRTPEFNTYQILVIQGTSRGSGPGLDFGSLV